MQNQTLRFFALRNKKILDKRCESMEAQERTVMCVGGGPFKGLEFSRVFSLTGGFFTVAGARRVKNGLDKIFLIEPNT